MTTENGYSARSAVDDVIREYYREEVRSIRERESDALAALGDIPASVPVSFSYGTLTVHSDDKSVFTGLAKIWDVQVKKSANQYRKTGQLTVACGRTTVYSSEIPLPETCTFKRVTRTYDVLEPEGNCGSWFKAEEEAPSEMTEVVEASGSSAGGGAEGGGEAGA